MDRIGIAIIKKDLSLEGLTSDKHEDYSKMEGNIEIMYRLLLLFSGFYHRFLTTNHVPIYVSCETGY